jgi:hypothetical protein
MHILLITYASTRVITPTVTPRSKIVFVGVLSTKLKERLNLVKANTFSELVNMALT